VANTILKTIGKVHCRCGGDSRCSQRRADAEAVRDGLMIRVAPRVPLAATGSTPKADWITKTLVLQARNARVKRSAAMAKQESCAASRAGRAIWRVRKISQAAWPNPQHRCVRVTVQGLDVPVSFPSRMRLRTSARVPETLYGSDMARNSAAGNLPLAARPRVGHIRLNGAVAEWLKAAVC
jgi:hypothetical protein